MDNKGNKYIIIAIAIIIDIGEISTNKSCPSPLSSLFQIFLKTVISFP